MSEILAAGNVRKMKTELAEPVQYLLPLGDTDLPVNPNKRSTSVSTILTTPGTFRAVKRAIVSRTSGSTVTLPGITCVSISVPSFYNMRFSL